MKYKRINKILMVIISSATLFSHPLTLVRAVHSESELTPMSILLLGVDTGSLGRTETGRSDVIMVMTFNPKTSKTTLTSIPRDTYVEIPGYGMDKMNHAYAYGGIDLSKETVNQFFDIDLDHYVVVNMAGLEQIVDAVGGVEVNPPSSFEIGGYYFEAGIPVNLNGEMALAYVRERYTSGGDYARQERQREVISAVAKKNIDLGTFTNIKELLTVMDSNVKMDMNLIDLMNLFIKYKDNLTLIEDYQLSGDGQMIDEIYYEIPNEKIYEEIKEMLKIQLD